MIEGPLRQIIIIILSATPLSLILISQFHKIFARYSSNLGRTTVICSNLTGTLTKNELIVKGLSLDKQDITVQHDSDVVKIENTDTKEEIKVEKTYLKDNEEARICATTTHLVHYAKVSELEKIVEKFFLECGFNKIKTDNDYLRVQEIASSDDKKISTAVALKIETDEIFAFSKGNPESVLNVCTRIIVKGKKQKLTPALKAKIRKKIKKMNAGGQKLIAFAYKGLPKKRLDHYPSEFTENDLIFVGMIGLANPINFDLQDTIATARKSGIKIYVMTGHKERKAISTAEKLGIIDKQYFEPITGNDLEDINEQKLQKILSNKEKDYVFAELKEEDKIRIMENLKQLGEVVAIANRESGNDFASIVEGINNERALSFNARKYFHHALSCKIAELLLIVTALIIGAPNPFSILSLLIVDIAINMILEFALQKDPIPPSLLKSAQLPKTMDGKQIISSGLITYSILAIVYFFFLISYGWTPGEYISTQESVVIKTGTIILILLGLIQILNAYNFRLLDKSIFSKKFFANRYLLLTTIIVGLILYLLFFIPSITSTFRFSEIGSIEWRVIAFSLFIFLASEEIRKVIIRHKKKQNHENPDQ